MLLSDFQWRKSRWSPQTQIVYDVTWRAFVQYAKSREVENFPAPPEIVAEFLPVYAENHSTSGVSLALCAIRAAHKDVKGTLPKLDGQRELYVLDDPMIVDAWKDIARTKGTAKTPKMALTKKEIRKMLKAIPAECIQDRAIVLFGFASAMRRAEIAALNRDDLEFTDDDLTVIVRRSKTDKEGRGEPVAILRAEGENCPVRALEAWLQHMDITDGPIFRTARDTRIEGRYVATVAKKYAKAVGIDPERVGAHSFRRGCITEMNRAGVDLKSGMTHSRHKSSGIYLGYVEVENARKNPAIRELSI